MFFEFEGEGEMIIDLVETLPDIIRDSCPNNSGQCIFIRRFDGNRFGVTDVCTEDRDRLCDPKYEEIMCQIESTLLTFSNCQEMWRSMLARPGRITLPAKDSPIVDYAFNLCDPIRKREEGGS